MRRLSFALPGEDLRKEIVCKPGPTGHDVAFAYSKLL